MVDKDVARFFAEAYDNRGLQGTLHAALVKAAPEVVVAIARHKGFDFTEDELKATAQPPDAELSEGDLDQVAGGARLSSSSLSLSNSAMSYNFWGSFSRFGSGIGTQAFGLGIPGPTFVQAMSDEPRTNEKKASKASASELYASLDD